MKIDGKGRGIRNVYKRGRRREPKKINPSLGRFGSSGAATNTYRQGREEGLSDGTQRLERDAKRDDDFPVSPRHGIYTSQSTVIYEWPSEVIESKCK